MLIRGAQCARDDHRIRPIAMLRVVAGMICVGLGVIGVVVPLLPTTPFLLLALWFFAEASPRLHRWLLTHPRFGPGLRAWRTHGAINRKAKLWAMVALAATPLVSLAAGVASHVLWVQAAILPLCALFILTRPGMGSPDDTGNQVPFSRPQEPGSTEGLP